MGCQCRGAHAIAPVQGRLCKGACAGVLAQWASRSRSERVWPGRWAVLPQNCGQKTGKTGKNSNSCDSFQKTVRDWLWAGRSRANMRAGIIERFAMEFGQRAYPESLHRGHVQEVVRKCLSKWFGQTVSKTSRSPALPASARFREGRNRAGNT